MDAADTPFGDLPSSRFGADVEYRGRAHGHDYVVRVRHRLLDTTFTVSIDGVEHDPKAEAKKAEAKKAEAKKAGDGADDLGFRYDEGIMTNRATVLRTGPDDHAADDHAAEDPDAAAEAEADADADPDADGRWRDAETIVVRTSGLGGAGEVDVLLGIEREPLAPADGSPSAERDRRRTEHPVRYATIAAAGTAVRFLIPILGIGALLSGLLKPVREWAWNLVRPAVEALAAVRDRVVAWADELTRPVREFIDELTLPIREFVDESTRPVRELVGAAVRTIMDGIGWLLGRLLGWIPDVPDGVKIIVVVLVAFLVAHERLRARRKGLARARGDGGDGGDGTEDSVAPEEDSEEDSGDPDDPRTEHSSPT